MIKPNKTIESFLQYLEAERNASPRTITAYRHALLGFTEFIGGNVRWYTIRPDNFRAFLGHCTRTGMARSYTRLTFSALRSFYRFLVERQGYPSNPIADIQLPKLSKSLPVVLSPAQIEELISAPQHGKLDCQAPAWTAYRDTAMIELFYSSGLRLNELAALDCSDLDLYTETVRVLGKGSKETRSPGGRAGSQSD